MSPVEFRRRRQLLGLTQQQLAREIGVTATTVARWERGERDISNGVMVGLALDQIGLRRRRRLDAVPGRPEGELVGRRRDVAHIARMVRDGKARWVTLTGVGGVGKTALALAAARVLAPHRACGASVVELASLAPGSSIESAMLRDLRITELTGQSPRDSLAWALRTSDEVLVLDNCEHVAASCAALLAELLPRCPGLSVLVTSRVPLRAPAEHRFRVGPLPVPDPERLPPLHSLALVPAVALFVQRWSATNPGYRLSGADSKAVAEVCARLDGLPLALELAAADRPGATVDDLLRRLRRADPLVAGPGVRPERHRSLRSVLDVSYDLFDPVAQRALRHAGVFAGTFDPDCAAALVTDFDTDQETVHAALAQLVDAGLVIVVESPGARPRCRLLETVRSYALEKLTEHREHQVAALRLTRWLADWAEHLDGSDQPGWAEAVDSELPNIRAGLAWSLGPGGDPTLGLRLGAATRRYWDMRGMGSEGEQLLKASLDVGDGPVTARLAVLLELAGLATRREDIAAMERFGREAERVARDLDDERGISLALSALTYVAFLRRDPGQRAIAEEALARAEAASDAEAIDHARMAMGAAALGSAAPERAVGLLASAFDGADRRRDLWMMAECAGTLAGVLVSLGDFPAARAQAVASYAAGAACRRHPNHVYLRLVAVVDAATGQHRRAAALFGVAEAIEESTGAVAVSWAEATPDAETSARDALGADRFRRLRAAGRQARDADISALVYGLPAAILAGPAPRSTGSRALTERELQVAGLIAEGLTSPAIAQRLGISARTAGSHTEHILVKLGFHSRAQVAAWFARNGGDRVTPEPQDAGALRRPPPRKGRVTT